MSELRASFHAELDNIKAELVRIAASVTEAIPRATQILLDQDLDPDAMPQAELLLELREQSVEEPDVARGLHLRHDDEIDAIAGALDHGEGVFVRPRRLRTVDAHGACLLAEVELAQRADGEVARARLRVGCDRILEIEENEIGVGCGGLRHHLLARGGGGELGTA